MKEDSKRWRKVVKTKEQDSKMAIVSPYLSIITLNINRLSSPIKKHKAVEWIKKIIKTRSNHMLPKETHFSFKETNRL